MSRFAGKTVVVTGSGRHNGLGQGILQRFAEEGANCVVSDMTIGEEAEQVASELRGRGAAVETVACDVSDPAQCAALIDQAARRFDGVDILVNNAAIALWGSLEEMSLKDIDALLNVNVRGVILACQAAIPHLGEGGRIINIGSSAGERINVGGVSVYAATKSALRSLTAGLSRELGPRGVTVNLVQPGSTDTEMNPADGEHAASQLGIISLGRFAKPEDIAPAVVFLAGPGGRFITGTTITVDGGAIA